MAQGHAIAPWLRRLAAMALVLAACGCTAIEAASAPRPELWPRWQAQDEGSTVHVDHAAWDRFLAAYVVAGADGINRVAYGRAAPADRAALRGYVAGLARQPVSRLARAEQLALWVNLYNALTVAVVLEHYPVRSIRDVAISPGLLAVGPWGRKLVTVEGEALSLDDIEHRILRPIWRDPRIHYALNCASLGCPNLQRRAFTAATSEALLDEAARDYVNHPRGALVAAGRLRVSSIYVWYQEDFGGSDAGVIAHLRRYARPELAAQLAELRRVDSSDYDWRLNDAP